MAQNTNLPSHLRRKLKIILSRPSSSYSHLLNMISLFQLWQSIFEDTFRQYHRLSSQMAAQQDVRSAVALWEDYLKNVEEYITEDQNLPGSYEGLMEQRRICEVHRNLLLNHQQLLQSRHQELRRNGEGMHDPGVDVVAQLGALEKVLCNVFLNASVVASRSYISPRERALALPMQLFPQARKKCSLSTNADIKQWQG